MHRPQRIVVVGTSGSGKSTTAARLARAFGLEHVELDGLFWNAGWQGTPDDEFRARVAAAVAGDRWVVDGNYTRVRDLVWPRAELVVWIDLPRGVTLFRVLRRTVARGLGRKLLWNGNRERIFGVFARDSVVRWSWNTYGPNRAKYEAAFAQRAREGLPSLRLRGTRALERAVAEVERCFFPGARENG